MASSQSLRQLLAALHQGTGSPALLPVTSKFCSFLKGDSGRASGLPARAAHALGSRRGVSALGLVCFSNFWFSWMFLHPSPLIFTRPRTEDTATRKLGSRLFASCAASGLFLTFAKPWPPQL